MSSQDYLEADTFVIGGHSYIAAGAGIFYNDDNRSNLLYDRLGSPDGILRLS